MIDWTSVVNTFVATLPLTITAIGGLIIVIRKVEQVHVATNSLTDRLVALTRIEAHAAGVKEEKDRHKSLKRGDR